MTEFVCLYVESCVFVRLCVRVSSLYQVVSLGHIRSVPVTWSWSNEIVTLWMRNKSSHIILFEEKINSTPKHRSPIHHTVSPLWLYTKSLPQCVCVCVCFGVAVVASQLCKYMYFRGSGISMSLFRLRLLSLSWNTPHSWTTRKRWSSAWDWVIIHDVEVEINSSNRGPPYCLLGLNMPLDLNCSCRIVATYEHDNSERICDFTIYFWKTNLLLIF